MEDGKICPELVSRWELENNLSFIHAVMLFNYEKQYEKS